MNELRTTVRNISGTTLRFSFLPPHGVELADGDTYSWTGGLTDIGGAAGQESASRTRAHRALQSSLDTGLLEVVSTPTPVFFDPTAAKPQVLTVDNAVIAAADTSWAP
jgi:hypothetical protein